MEISCGKDCIPKSALRTTRAFCVKRNRGTDLPLEFPGLIHTNPDDGGIRWAGQFRLVCCVMLQSSGDNFSVTGQRKYAIAEHCVLSLQ